MLFKNRQEIINNGETVELRKTREDILNILEESVKSVDPYFSVKSKINNNCIVFDKKVIDTSSFENIYLAGFGKASVGMAQAACDSLNVKKGIVITNDPQQKVKNGSVETIVGGHPIPNQGSIKGTEKIIELFKKSKEKDLIINLISGGGSALLEKPRVNLSDLQSITNLLLKSGADINEINTVRKHLSNVKGGQLVTNIKGNLISLIISDIIGDPISFIASGPTYYDSTSFSDAKNVLKKYNLWSKIPGSVRKVINDGLNGIINDTPKKDDFVFKNVQNFIVANNNIACETAVEKAKRLGYKTMLLTTSLDGEAKEVGKFLADKALNYANSDKYYLFISGGETTVTVHGDGKGGRNSEMVLGCVKDIKESNVVFASFATDGVDGNSNAAGAIADGFTYAKAKDKNLDFELYLKNNNAYNFFNSLGDLFITGPTGTNVMDIQIIVKQRN